MRSMIVAQSVAEAWPQANIAFVLNRNAPYAEHCPFKTYLLDSSPTKDSDSVNQIIRDICPDIVVFDASGRQSQLKQAKKVGATTVFFSQHAKKRRKGLKLGRAKWTDHHFVVQPEYAIKPLSWLERLNIRLFNLTPPKSIGVVFRPAESTLKEQLQQQYQLCDKDYVLFSAGSGGHQFGDHAASEVMFSQASRVAASLNVKTVVVMGCNYTGELPQSTDSVEVISALDNQAFITLLSGAKAAVLSGGGTMLQSIALTIPTFAIAVSKDQPNRIKACLSQNLICTATEDTLEHALDDFLKPNSLTHWQKKLQLQPSGNGVPYLIQKFSQILEGVDLS
ncbi:hypothetical protein [Parashewanella tropica]|uniref:hypothetical protein n=1 Tax=Parashewanella tropica TaxID=2547970 RepID=UPI0010594EA1|nr:hypothetical protein [Parashewanella tropica]